MSNEQLEKLLQQNYYSASANQYDDFHVDSGSDHAFALSFLVATLDYLQISSVLDIGSGTGRVISCIQDKYPAIKVIGIEPVEAMREVGYSKGLSRDELIHGDANYINFGDSSFDLVCEFGVLHHVPHPENVVGEMLRVARKAIFISDSNNFGQGSLLFRTGKQLLNSMRLWCAMNFLKTRGKGYSLSEGDGLAYSYSVFNNYQQIRKACRSVHIFNTGRGGVNLYRSAGHVALLGIL